MPTYDYDQFSVRVQCPRDIGTIYKMTIRCWILKNGDRCLMPCQCDDWHTHCRTATCDRCTESIYDLLLRNYSPKGGQIPPQPLDPNV